MAPGGRELISRATRRHFREYAPGIVFREIDGIWSDEGFTVSAAVDDTITGVRRARYEL